MKPVIKQEGCEYTHKCGTCTRIVAREKRAEERDAEKAARKREKRKKSKGGNWAIYTAIVIAFIMAVGVVSKTAETTTAKQTTQQGETK